MVNRKIQRLIVLTFFSILILIAGLRADDVFRQWQSFTSYGQVKQMVYYRDAVWAATTGGLVKIDPLTMTYKTYSNVDGLATNTLYSLCVDSKDRLWIGGEGRLINFTDPDNPDVYLFTDREGQLIDVYDIECSPDGDSLWLANRAGLSLFLASDIYAQGLIVDTYNRFGTIPRDVPALRVTLDSDSIWVGTTSGMAVGSRFDVRQLKAPSGWLSYFPSQMSATGVEDEVRGLEIKDDTLYVGTTSGLYRFETSDPQTLINLGLFNNPIIYDIDIIGDSIFVASSRGSGFYYNGVYQEPVWAGLPNGNFNCTAGAIDQDGVFWFGHLSSGVLYLPDTAFVPYDVGGLPSNDCRQVVAAQGKIWGAFWSSGLACYQDGSWQKVDDSLISGLVNTLAEGPRGELWVGTFGNGLYRIDGDSLAHFDTDNSQLSGIPADSDYVVITDIYSSGDAVWFANFYGLDGELVVVDPNDLTRWHDYKFFSAAQPEGLVSVAVGQGVVYGGTSNNGIHAVSYSGTPFDESDDYSWDFVSTNSGIGSDIINYLRVDKFDTLWVGTSFGLSYQALGEIFFTNVSLPENFGPEVVTFDFDGQGSLYAGSAHGMIVRDIASGDYTYLTANNSGLVSDDIRHIYYNSFEHAFWISTASGISKMTMPYSLATEDVEQVLAYPNPYVIRFGDEVVRFNFSGISQIRIFTLAGELVREIPITGYWDGLNSEGEAVASGVYVFTITNRDEKVGRGKILLVRE